MARRSPSRPSLCRAAERRLQGSVAEEQEAPLLRQRPRAAPSRRTAPRRGSRPGRVGELGHVGEEERHGVSGVDESGRAGRWCHLRPRRQWRAGRARVRPARLARSRPASGRSASSCSPADAPRRASARQAALEVAPTYRSWPVTSPITAATEPFCRVTASMKSPPSSMRLSPPLGRVASPTRSVATLTVGERLAWKRRYSAATSCCAWVRCACASAMGRRARRSVAPRRARCVRSGCSSPAHREQGDRLIVRGYGARLSARPVSGVAERAALRVRMMSWMNCGRRLSASSLESSIEGSMTCRSAVSRRYGSAPDSWFLHAKSATRPLEGRGRRHVSPVPLWRGRRGGTAA